MPETSYEILNAEIDAQLVRTARFIPAAFHVHSIDSYDWGKDGDVETNWRTQFEGAEGQDAFLDRLIAAGLGLVVITDHMKCAYACELADRAQTRDDITVFPGMEISCRTDPGHDGRIHLLVAFPPGTSPDVIARIFAGQRDLPGEEDRDGKEEIRLQSTADFRSDVETAGGILLLAHNDEQNRGHRSFVRRALGEDIEMLAISADGAEVKRDVSAIYGEFLVDAEPAAVEVRDSQDSGHYAHFETADGRSHTLACVAQSDFHSVEDLRQPERFTHVKLSSTEFDCVVDALRFRDTRVRFAEDLPSSPTPRLVGMRLRSPSEGFFEELVLGFNENLNCVIGARGCGKSTVVEALRYVLGQRPLLTGSPGGDTSERSFAELALATQEANLADTQIELIYESGNERHVLSATYDPDEDSTTTVLTLAGADCHVGAEALPQAYPALIFSWGELETLGREPRLQRIVVDRLSDELPDLDERRAAAIAALANNRQEIEGKVAALERILAEEGGALRRYSELRERFQRMNTAEVAELFASLDAVRQRIATLEELDSALAALATRLESLDAGGPERVVAELSDELAAWFSEELAGDLALSELRSRVESSAADLAREVAQRRASTASRLTAERGRREETEERLREKTQADAEVAIRSQQREEARRRFEQADSLRARYLEAYRDLDDLLSARAKLITDAEVARGAISAKRTEVAGALSAELAQIGGESPLVSILVEPGADRAQLEAFLENEFLNSERGGQYKSQGLAQKLSPLGVTALAWALIVGSAQQVQDGQTEVSEAQAERLVGAVVPFEHDGDADLTVPTSELSELLRLQEEPVDDRVRILSDGKPVDKLSPGGRSSAMLPLIALSDTAPLIIDQPEDNLDNRMVGNTLSSILAHLKERRQIVVTTHNPNIVVGGDAEQVAVLRAIDDRSAELELTGNIDDEDVIDAVIKIMEGGREAFEARERRYVRHLT